MINFSGMISLQSIVCVKKHLYTTFYHACLPIKWVVITTKLKPKTRLNRNGGKALQKGSS